MTNFDGICSILGKKGTLLIPSYSWEFINKKNFSTKQVSQLVEV